ncbi:hypothetical protein HYX05_01245 [Candidatus Woesearchaeota archaeon]|nr:hypothetical protein [Candidatus Woesearchaeota archaeon]
MSEKTKTPSLEEMLSTEAEGGVKYASAIAGFLDGIGVPTKDDKPDIDALIKSLVEGAKPVLGSNLNPDAKDPQWLPAYDAIKNLFETYKNPVENGKLRKEVKDALANLYETTAQNYIVSRAQGRVQTSPVEPGKEFGKAIATSTSNKYLTALIDAAKTPAEVASRVSQAITDLYSKAKQWYALNGNLSGFQPAYATGKTHK